MAKALGDLQVGHHGLIRAGEDVPKTYIDSRGDEQRTDFQRLADLGLVDKRAKPAAETPPDPPPPEDPPADPPPAE